MIRIAIADDHKMFCAGLKAMLEDEEHIQIIKTVHNGKLLLEYLKNNPIDVVLMDINMPEINGIKASKYILKQYKKTKIIILSMYQQPLVVGELLKLGVHAYILKDTEKSELLKAINTVSKGGKYFDKRVTEVFMDNLYNPEANERIKLTIREKQILKLICESKTTQQIASELFISPHTVETHRKNLLSKTSANNSMGLAKFANENALFL